jgi:hypothetical protein
VGGEMGNGMDTEGSRRSSTIPVHMRTAKSNLPNTEKEREERGLWACNGEENLFKAHCPHLGNYPVTPQVLIRYANSNFFLNAEIHKMFSAQRIDTSLRQ